MADVSITTASVQLVGSSATGLSVIYGETIVEGELVYLDQTTGRYKKSKSQGTLAESQASGMALTPGGDGDAGYIAKSGATVKLSGSSVLTSAGIYAVGLATGKLAPAADVLVNLGYTTIVGVAASASTIALHFHASGVQE